MTFLGGLWAKLIAIGAIVAAILWAVAKIFYAGKTAARVEQMEKTLERTHEAKKIDDAVRADTDAELDERLRKQSGGRE